MYQHNLPQSKRKSSSSVASSSYYDDLRSNTSEPSYAEEIQQRLRKYTKPNQGLFYDDDELYQLDQSSELSYSEDQTDRLNASSSRELLRESKLTRMEAKIGLIQSNLTELQDEMRRIQNPDDRKSTLQLQQELRMADDILKRLEQEEISDRATPRKSVQAKKEISIVNDEPNDIESQIDQEMNIVKRIYADNLEFLLVVLKEMKFITSNNSRMECLDFLSQIRKKEEGEIEKLKSPKRMSDSSSFNNKSSTSLSRTLPISDAVSVSTSLRAMANSDKDTESIVSEDTDRSFAVTAELIGFVTTKVEDLLSKMASEKLDEGSRGVVSKGDVIHLCKETWSLLQELDIECEVETINPIFDVLELFIGKEVDSQTQEDMLTDVMDVITTYLFYYRAVSQIISSTSGMSSKDQRSFLESRLEKLRQKKDTDLESIVRNRTRYIRFKDKSGDIDQQTGDEESSFVDEEEEDEEESERNYTPLDNIMTLEELMERNGLNDIDLDEEIRQRSEIQEDEDEDEVAEDDEEDYEDEEIETDSEVPIEVVRSSKYQVPEVSSKSNSPKRSEELQKISDSNILKQMGFNVNNDKIKRMMEDEENDLEIQFLSRVSAITVPGSNEDRDYSDFVAKHFSK